MVRYDRGTDWCLEESGESYQLIRQEKGQGEACDTYLYYTAKRMPMDWMGSVLLESVIVPYRIWKEEDGVRWDQLGNWYRYRGPDTGRTIESQWKDVQQWRRGECSAPVAIHTAISIPEVMTVTDIDRPVRGKDMEKGRYLSYANHGQENRWDHGRGGDRGRGGGDRGRGNIII